MNLIESLSAFVWGPVMLVLLLGAGLYFTLRGRWMQITQWRLMWKKTFGAMFRGPAKPKGGLTPFQAMSTALAASVGTGNIVGVAAALTAGGPGAIFWMWVSAFFGMITKFAEVVLGQIYRQPDGKGGFVGGPMYFIRYGLGNRFLAAAFAVLGVLASLGVGNMIQTGAIAQAITEQTNISAHTVGLVTMLVAGLVILGGAKSIARVTERLVPFMAGLYIIGTLLIIFLNIERVAPSFGLIFREAFRLRPAVAGAGGFLLTKILRTGLQFGVFSNEAGMGSSAIAHAAADAKDPVEQGFWGAMEVFVDTLVICTLTALAILSSGVFDLDRWLLQASKDALPAFAEAASSAHSGLSEALHVDAFHTLGPFGGGLLVVCTVLFAVATIIGWSFYGETCCRYLFPRGTKKAILCYRVFYIAVIYVGATAGMDALWNLSHLLNGLMAVPNLIALFFLSGMVFKATKRYFGRGDLPRNKKEF